MRNGTTAITLKKWGNSVGLLLPATVAKAMQIGSGSQMVIEVLEDSIVIRKASGQSKFEELCAAITAENLHSESTWGDPQGNEAW